MNTLPPEIADFARQYIGSLEDLQVLMTCLDGRDRWWDAATMGREIGIGTTTARRALDHLARGNLLDIRITGDVRYQFNPGTEELLTAAQAFAAAYRSNPVAVVQLVAGTARRSVRDFADAFRIRRDDDS
jgi:hypothetical protein